MSRVLRKTAVTLSTDKLFNTGLVFGQYMFPIEFHVLPVCKLCEEADKNKGTSREVNFQVVADSTLKSENDNTPRRLNTNIK